MESAAEYCKRFFTQVWRPELMVVEATLIGVLLTMLAISVAEAFVGRDIGNPQAVRMAKLQAQQELMALNRAEQK